MKLQKNNNILELRNRKELSQNTVATYLNYKQNSYSFLEREKRRISINTVLKLAILYDVSILYLLSIDENPTKLDPHSRKTIMKHYKITE